MENYHRHSFYSNIYTPDSVASNEEYAKRAVELEQKTLSSAEHGWAGYYFQTYEFAKKYGLKPIIGAEAYWVKDRFEKDRSNHHIIILAKSNQGREALNDILSEANISGYYFKPRIDLDLLFQLPPKDVMVTSACFLPGALVETQNGQKNIEMISQYDCVKNLYGEWEKVNFPTRIAYQGLGYRIKTEQGDFSCTADHKFLVVRHDGHTKKDYVSWKPMQEILAKHSKPEFLYPIHLNYSNNVKLNKQDFDGAFKQIQHPWSVKQKLNSDIIISPELMRLFGLFLGDGHITLGKNPRVGFTFHEEEYPFFYNDCFLPVEQQLNIKFSVTHRESSHRVDLTSSCVDFVNLFYYLFGDCKAHNKSIPKRLLHISKELDMELFWGLLLSDGNVRKTTSRGRFTFVTISSQLAQQMCTLMDSLELKPLLHSVEPYTSKGVEHQRSYYVDCHCAVFGNISKRSHFAHEQVVELLTDPYKNNNRKPFLHHEGVVYKKVGLRHWEEIFINDYVYCLNNNTHSFVVGGVVAHNCIAFSGYDDIDYLIGQMHDYFGDNFNLEVQYHNTEKQKVWNKHLVELSQQQSIPLIVGMDSHYILPEDAQLRDYILDAKNMHYEDEDGWYMDYPDEQTVYDRFIEQNILTPLQVERAIKNTEVVREFCDYDNVRIFTRDIKLPTLYPELTKEQKDKKYSQLITKKFKEYMKSVPESEYQRYFDGVKAEIQTYKDTGMCDYPLLDYAIIKDAVEHGGLITDTGRGSAVGFFTNTLCGFSKVDRFTSAIKLYPERFISTTRILESKSLPDIDMNCGNVEVFEESQKRVLGDDHAAPMLAFGTLKKRSAFKLYAKAKGMEFELANTISEQIGKYEEAVKNAGDEGDEIDIYEYVDPQYTDYIEQSKEYWGTVVDKKKAPSAYLLYQGNIRREIGLIKCKSETTKKEYITCCMDGAVAESFKFLKNDLLKVDVVLLIAKVFERIGIEHFNVNELIRRVQTDPQVWDLYAKGYTIGINQVEQEGSKQKCMRYKPSNISELSAFVAAIRPGFKSMYKRFENREDFAWGIPTLDNLLRTEELPVSFLFFQEQVMAVLNYAGFPMDECYGAIKNIAKKHPEKVRPLKQKFIDGFREKLMEDEDLDVATAQDNAEKVWQIVNDNCGYGFNSAHAYCMALDSLYQAWQKTHYPLEFYEVLLNHYSDKGNKDKVAALKREMREAFGITEGDYKFRSDNRRFVAVPEKNQINPSLVSIKGLSQQLADELYELRTHEFASFIDLLDVLKNTSCNAGKLDTLIRINYFSEFGAVNTLLQQVEQYNALRAAKILTLAKLPQGLSMKLVEQYAGKITAKQAKDFDSRKLLDAWFKATEYPKTKTLDIIKNELEFIGYSKHSIVNADEDIYVVAETTGFGNKILVLYQVKTGNMKTIKCRPGKQKLPIKGDVIKVYEIINDFKKRLIDGKWINLDEREKVLTKFSFLT